MFVRYKLMFKIIRGKKENFYNLKYLFYSLLLQKIASFDKELARKIHDNENEYKRAFLFSNFIFTKKRVFSVYFATTKKEIEQILFKILQTPLFFNEDKTIVFELSTIYRQQIEIDKINMLNFLSPIVIRTKDGKSKITENKESYNKLIEQEVIRTINSVSSKVGVELEDYSIRVDGTFRKKIFVFQNSKNQKVQIHALEAIDPKANISFEGDSNAKVIAYLYGVGDRTNLGFGMLGVLTK
ncbi:MAG: CRISPR-associated endoribonuclease Cas6 [Candidatus Anstonellaceae archaeon]